jgi:hypothetical protein
MHNAYALLKSYLELGYEDLFAKIAKPDTHDMSAEDLASNPFKVGVRALTVDDSISRQDRHQYSEQFLAAHERAIEPDDLLGFLSQQGGPQAHDPRTKGSQP